MSAGFGYSYFDSLEANAKARTFGADKPLTLADFKRTLLEVMNPRPITVINATGLAEVVDGGKLLSAETLHDCEAKRFLQRKGVVSGRWQRRVMAYGGSKFAMQLAPIIVTIEKYKII